MVESPIEASSLAGLQDLRRWNSWRKQDKALIGTTTQCHAAAL